jgi:hypothetical protein
MVDIDRATKALAKAKDRTDLNAALASFYSLHHSAFLPKDGDDSDEDEDDKKNAFEASVKVSWSKAKNEEGLPRKHLSRITTKAPLGAFVAGAFLKTRW